MSPGFPFFWVFQLGLVVCQLRAFLGRSKTIVFFSSRATVAATPRTRWWVVMSPSGSAQYSGRAAMMAKVASMAGTSAEQGGAPVRLGSDEMA